MEKILQHALTWRSASPLAPWRSAESAPDLPPPGPSLMAAGCASGVCCGGGSRPPGQPLLCWQIPRAARWVQKHLAVRTRGLAAKLRPSPWALKTRISCVLIKTNRSLSALRYNWLRKEETILQQQRERLPPSLQIRTAWRSATLAWVPTKCHVWTACVPRFDKLLFAFLASDVDLPFSASQITSN